MNNCYKLLWVISVVVTLMISACSGNNNETPGLQSARENQTDTLPATVESTDDNNAVGALIILSQEILYRWDFSTESPEVIARDVSEDNMVLSPASDSVFYVVREDGAAVLYQADTQTGETGRIYELGRLRFRTELQWQLGNWSPNHDWAILTSFDFGIGPTLISTAGAADAVVLSQNFVNTLWLDDGRIVTYEQNFQGFDENTDPGAFAPIVSLTIVDPESGERLEPEWVSDLEEINSFELFLATLAENDLNVTFSTPDELASLPGNAQIDFGEGVFFSGGGEFCFPLSISQIGANEQREIIYERDDVFTFLDLHEVGDGSLIFGQVSYPDCTLSTPIGELVHLQPSQEQEILTDQLTSQLDQNGFNDRFFDINQRLAISPDMEHVAWIEMTPEGNQSSLIIWNVATNEISPVSFDIPEFRPRRIFWVQ
ncbi:MAG: hypothetical protein L0154_29965 [Chloroflexi bacterium]|nr:hypothetical protein [Chloroflexota bacterium]